MKKGIAFLALFFLTACIGTSLPTTFYTLRSEKPAHIYQEKLTIGIEPVKVPAFLDKPQIVTRQKDGIQLKFSETNRWSEPLSSLLQRTLTEDIAQALPKAEVKSKISARERFEYIVLVEISDMTGIFNEKMTLNAWFSILNQTGAVLIRRKVLLSKDLEDTYNHLVLTQSQLIGQLADHIAQQISLLQKEKK